MLGMGFYDDWNLSFNVLFKSIRRFFFSATMPAQIRTIAKKHMHKPLEVELIQKEKAQIIFNMLLSFVNTLID